jgi:hypothetical protein
MLTLAVYNLFLFFFVRERTHLYHAADVVFAVGLYEVLDGLPPDERARKLADRAPFESAVDAYVSADVVAARTAFSAWPEDRAAALYLDLCARAEDAARASWDGAIRLDAK